MIDIDRTRLAVSKDLAAVEILNITAAVAMRVQLETQLLLLELIEEMRLIRFAVAPGVPQSAEPAQERGDVV